MRIVRKDKNDRIHFGALRVGDVFIETVEGDNEYIQMKTSPIETDVCIYNAVSLASGEMYDMADDTWVRLVTGEVIIS